MEPISVITLAYKIITYPFVLAGRFMTSRIEQVVKLNDIVRDIYDRAEKEMRAVCVHYKRSEKNNEDLRRLLHQIPDVLHKTVVLDPNYKTFLDREGKENLHSLILFFLNGKPRGERMFKPFSHETIAWYQMVDRVAAEFQDHITAFDRASK